MKSITIHKLDDKLDYLIREIARKRGLSLNQTIQMLLKEALGLQSKHSRNHKNDFTDIYGVWSAKDYSDFENKTKEFNEIHDQDWE